MTTSHTVSKDLFLVRQALPALTTPVVVDIPTNNILVIDVSGSMYSELPKIREQLKKKLPKLLKEKDTLSIIWFSGKGEFGTLIEAEPVATLSDLNEVNKAIDRWLKVVGLTGFREPLEEVSRLVARIGAKTPGSVFSLFMLTDGGNNVGTSAEVLKAVETAAKGLASSTFVEYGYYADRNLLAKMAEKSGGNLIFAQDFDKYAPQFEAAMSKSNLSAKKVEVRIEGDVVGGLVFALSGKDILTFCLEEGKVYVPEQVTEVGYLSSTSVGKKGTDIRAVAGNVAGKFDGRSQEGDSTALSFAYAATSLFSVRMKPEVVFPLLKVIADVRLIQDFSNCFGKQKYSEFMDLAKLATFEVKERYTQGFNENLVPREDAFTVLQLLETLASDDANRVLLDHPAFQYSRIGRGRIDSSTLLTTAEQEEIEKLTQEMVTHIKDVKKVKELSAQIDAITSKKGDALKFAESSPEEGYPISNLVYNESRPNISIQVRKEGKVDLSSRLPAEFKGDMLGCVPENFPSFIFRNYAVIKDGLVNIDKLPVRITEATFSKLKAEGVVSGDYAADQVLDLKGLPIINREMVKNASAKDLFTFEWNLTKARAAQKVYNTYQKDKVPAVKSATFEAIYGPEAAAWLKEQGFTDYSGFAPKSVLAPPVDKYTAKELAVAIKGYSTIPSLNDYKKQASKGKFNGPGTLMTPTVTECEAFLASDIYKSSKHQERLFTTWIEGRCKEAKAEVRSLLAKKAQILFSVVVGQTWFTEFSSLDDTAYTLKLAEGDVNGEVQMREFEEAI